MVPMIVAHRGASGDAPENTLAAFELGWKQGADALEGDFHLTRDGRIVCIHDGSTGRVGDRDLKIAEHTLAELLEVDVGLHKGEPFRGQRIPTLAQVLATVPKGGKVFLELKSAAPIVAAMKAELTRLKFRLEQVMFISFDASVLAEAKRQLPDVQTSWLCGFHSQPGGWSPTVEKVVATLREICADGLDVNAHECVDERFVTKLRGAGMGFHCWTVDQPQVAKRFAALGVESITTNLPGAIRSSLKS